MRHRVAHYTVYQLNCVPLHRLRQSDARALHCTCTWAACMLCEVDTRGASAQQIATPPTLICPMTHSSTQTAQIPDQLYRRSLRPPLSSTPKTWTYGMKQCVMSSGSPDRCHMYRNVPHVECVHGVSFRNAFTLTPCVYGTTSQR